MVNSWLKYVALSCIIIVTNNNATMGDSGALSTKNMNFYGTLETYNGTVKEVEHITFWNRNTKTHVFEAPSNRNVILSEDKKIVLTFNPTISSTIATIELQEIKNVEVEKNQPLFTYTAKNNISQDYLLLKVTFHGASDPNYYLIPANEKIHVTQETGIESIELEVPMRSIKKLEIKGYNIQNKEIK